MMDDSPLMETVPQSELNRLRNIEKAFELMWAEFKETPKPVSFWWELHQLAGVLTRNDNKETP